MPRGRPKKEELTTNDVQVKDVVVEAVETVSVDTTDGPVEAYKATMKINVVHDNVTYSIGDEVLLNEDTYTWFKEHNFIF